MTAIGPPCQTATPCLTGLVCPLLVLALALVGSMETWSLLHDWRDKKRAIYPHSQAAGPDEGGFPRNPLSTVNSPTLLPAPRSHKTARPPTRNVSRPADVYWPRNINLRLDIVLDQTAAPPVANRSRSHPQAFSRPPAVHARQADIETRAKYPESHQRRREIYRFAHLFESGIPWPF